MIVVGTIAGAAWAAIAAFLRARWNANEILTTFMLSSVALQLLYYLVAGPLRDLSRPKLPSIGGIRRRRPVRHAHSRHARQHLLVSWSGRHDRCVRLHGATAFMAFGWSSADLRRSAARYAGFREARAVWIGLIAGGVCAGIAGVGEVAGPIGMLQRVLSPGYGFAAIIVAFLGGLHPIGIVFAAVLMALLYVGGDFALVSASVPNAFATIFQSLLLVFYLAGALLALTSAHIGRMQSG